MVFVVSTQGLKATAEMLGALREEASKASTLAVSQVSREIRKEFVDDIHEGTGLKKTLLRAGIRVESTHKKNGWGYARLVSSAKGLPITEYTWRAESAGHPTRARILIRWFGGWKVSPGFINPSSNTPLPLKTDLGATKLRKPALAHGISIAAAFKVVRDDGRASRYGARLAEVYEQNLQQLISNR